MSFKALRRAPVPFIAAAPTPSLTAPGCRCGPASPPTPHSVVDDVLPRRHLDLAEIDVDVSFLAVVGLLRGRAALRAANGTWHWSRRHW